eukprot:scaffold13833_cov193-Alexandrium_tamarense.AAC.2
MCKNVQQELFGWPSFFCSRSSKRRFNVPISSQLAHESELRNCCEGSRSNSIAGRQGTYYADKDTQIIYEYRVKGLRHKEVAGTALLTDTEGRSPALRDTKSLSFTRTRKW